MDLRAINDNENRLGAGSVSDLVRPFLSSAPSPVFQRSGRYASPNGRLPEDCGCGRCGGSIGGVGRVVCDSQALHLQNDFADTGG